MSYGPSTSGRELDLRCPFQLKLTGTKAGQLDLQLQLLSFKYGLHSQDQALPDMAVPESLQGKVTAQAKTLASLHHTLLSLPVNLYLQLTVALDLVSQDDILPKGGPQ